MSKVKIYNTLHRKKEELKEINKGKILMYHCGPTVYWIQHIGNMRAMVWADLIVKSLKYLGYSVKLTRNYTDVGHLVSDGDQGEDKIEVSAKKEKLSPKKISDKYIKIFEHDLKALNASQADIKPKATETIKEMIVMIQKLLDKGYAYMTDLAIYFDTSKVKNYTKLSGQKLDEQIKNAGKAKISDKNKKNAADFALWFFKAGKHKNALQYWKSPYHSELVENGEGFPGWHLECSVMANKFLGKTIDIHMGGVEHIPVHHTNEIAQSEAANGVKFVNYWIHNEHLLVDNGKMSKSEGTGYSLEEIIQKGFNPLALRYFFLQAHYRSKQNFTFEALRAAQNGLDNLYKSFKRLSAQNEAQVDKTFKKKFIDFISDDFNIPQALSLISKLLKSELSDEIKRATLLDFDKILSLDLDKIVFKKIVIPKRIQRLAEERQVARHNKDWDQADAIRLKIEELGYKIKDENNNFKIKKIN